MAKNLHLVFVSLTVLLALTVLNSAAMALRSIGLDRTSIQTEGRLRFDEVGLPGNTEITCDITLLRTTERAIAKREGARIGKLTGAAINIGLRGERCRHGSAISTVEGVIALRLRTERLETNSSCRETGNGVFLCDTTSPSPAERWDLIYRTFFGTLPNITSVLFRIRVAFKLQFKDSAFRVRHSCLYEGNLEALMEINAAGVVPDGRVLLATTLVQLLVRLEGIRCAREAMMEGSFTVTGRPRITLM